MNFTEEYDRLFKERYIVCNKCHKQITQEMKVAHDERWCPYCGNGLEAILDGFNLNNTDNIIEALDSVNSTYPISTNDLRVGVKDDI